MARFPAHKLPYKEQDRLWYIFCIVLSRLRKPDDIHRFLKDLMNRQERIMFVRRFQIARMLDEEKTYEQIMKTLHVGPDTIGRVQRWLRFGRDGYNHAIQKLLELEHEAGMHQQKRR